MAAAWWVAQVELILHTAEISESVPLIAALAAALALVVANRGLGWLARRGTRVRVLSRREIIVVYSALTLSTLMMSAKVSGYLIPAASAFRYFGMNDAHLLPVVKATPQWIAVGSDDAAQLLYEGLPTGDSLSSAPWGAWLSPMASWVLFMAALLATVHSMLSLFHGHWVRAERLSFPLLLIPEQLTDEDARDERSLFGSPLAWIGLGLSALFTLSLLIHAFSPTAQVFRARYPLSPFFTEHPWTALRGLAVEIRPEMMGMAYFMSAEMLLTLWTSSLAMELSRVGSAAAGWQVRGFPRQFDQGVGAFAMLALVLVWSARKSLWASLQATLGRHAPGSKPGRTDAVSWVSFVAGCCLTVAFAKAAGLQFWVSLYVVGTMLVFSLVYARARAEVGVPHPSAFPMGGLLLPAEYVGGPRMWSRGANAPLLAAFFFLGRGYTTTAAGAEVENCQLAERFEVSPSAMRWLCWLAPAFGLVVALSMRLLVGYRFGLNVLEGGTVEGGYPIRQIITHGETVLKGVELQAPPDLAARWGAIFGATATLALVLVRRSWLRFPLHPLGYALAMIRLRSFWAPILLTWLIKETVNRLGGARLSKRLEPAFLALAIGHYFFAGIVLGIVAYFFPYVLERVEVINFD